MDGSDDVAKLLADERRKAESKIADLKAINQHNLEALRKQKALHGAELEKRRRLEWRALQEKLNGIKDLKKTVEARNRELAQLTEQLLLKQNECDKLESEIKRLKHNESWSSISPTSSTEDLSTSIGPHITRRERDMAMRNSELSFRIRTLENNISMLKEQKRALESKLTSARDEVSPLKDQNAKLKVRSNELNGTLRLRERKVNQLSQELLHVKSSHQQLQEEYGKQQKSLKQHYTQLSEYQTEKQKLILKNEKLKEAYDKLIARVKELEENNSKLLEQSLPISLPNSPTPTVLEDDFLSLSSSNSQMQQHIDQLEFDKDEMEAKYEELKNEYMDVREKYKSLRHHYRQSQIKHDDVLLQIRRKNGFDQMSLEREVMLLRSARSDNLIDQARHEFILLSQKEKIERLVNRIEALENFIIEQDEVMTRIEEKCKEESHKHYDILQTGMNDHSNTMWEVMPVMQECSLESSDVGEKLEISHSTSDDTIHNMSNATNTTDSTTTESVQRSDEASPSDMSQRNSDSVFRLQIEKSTQTTLGDFGSSERFNNNVDNQTLATPVEGDNLSEDDTTGDLIPKHYTRIISDLENQLERSNNEISDLQKQFSEAQEYHNRLQLLLEELEQKLEFQEAAHQLQLKKSEAFMESELKTANDIILNLKTSVSSQPAKMNLAAKEISDAFMKVESACSKCKQDNLLSKQLQVLRDCIKRLSQVLSLNDEQNQELEITSQECEFFDFEPTLDNFKEFQKRSDTSGLELTRVFVVVMDYDPQSLCITGQPELELSVQSGSVISVIGQMDENGYYTAVYQNYKGIIPANFVQEIELQDDELMSRLTHQNIVWNTQSEKNTTLMLAGQESESVMSATSLESDQSKIGYTPDVQDQAYRIFIGLYDYDPQTSSSNMNPEFELKFKEGSLIKVFGQIMSDGYYIGELNGRRGLIPADFIADTSQYLKLAPPLHLKSKVVVAMYDYKPSKDSPNAFSETELEFKAGDHIVVFGYMHSDGFYTGHLGGNFGLVPSNFVQEQKNS